MGLPAEDIKKAVDRQKGRGYRWLYTRSNKRFQQDCLKRAKLLQPLNSPASSWLKGLAADLVVDMSEHRLFTEECP